MLFAAWGLAPHGDTKDEGDGKAVHSNEAEQPTEDHVQLQCLVAGRAVKLSSFLFFSAFTDAVKRL